MKKYQVMMVSEKALGIEFFPEVPGHHSVIVQRNEQTLAGSPFSVDVPSNEIYETPVFSLPDAKDKVKALHETEYHLELKNMTFPRDTG